MLSDLCALCVKAPVSLGSDKTPALLIALYCQPPVSLSELTAQVWGSWGRCSLQGEEEALQEQLTLSKQEGLRKSSNEDGITRGLGNIFPIHFIFFKQLSSGCLGQARECPHLAPWVLLLALSYLAWEKKTLSPSIKIDGYLEYWKGRAVRYRGIRSLSLGSAIVWFWEFCPLWCPVHCSVKENISPDLR